MMINHLHFEKQLSSQILYSASIYGLVVKLLLYIFSSCKGKANVKFKKCYLVSQKFPMSKVICSFRAISYMAFSYIPLTWTQQSCFIICSTDSTWVSRFMVGSSLFSYLLNIIHNIKGDLIYYLFSLKFLYSNNIFMFSKWWNCVLGYSL